LHPEDVLPDSDDSVQALRATERLRDRKTGEWVHKPPPPPLRMVRKGAWTYEEIEPPVTEPGQPVAPPDGQ
jgi:hypothetical protein